MLRSRMQLGVKLGERPRGFARGAGDDVAQQESYSRTAPRR